MVERRSAYAKPTTPLTTYDAQMTQHTPHNKRRRTGPIWLATPLLPPAKHAYDAPNRPPREGERNVSGTSVFGMDSEHPGDVAMDCIIALSTRKCKKLLKVYCGPRDPATRKRTEVALLPVESPAWALVAAVLCRGKGTTHRWRRRFEQGSVEASVGGRWGRRSGSPPWLIRIAV
jgi:hypothetical protein